MDCKGPTEIYMYGRTVVGFGIRAQSASIPVLAHANYDVLPSVNIKYFQ